MRTRLVQLAVAVLAMPLFACSKMDPKECTKLRDTAFELINTANVCTADAECKPSEWPGCSKPVNVQNFDKMHAMMESFKKGKCEEKLPQCKPYRIDGCFARAAPPRIAALDCFSWAPPRPEIRSANFLVHRFDRNDALAAHRLHRIENGRAPGGNNRDRNEGNEHHRSKAEKIGGIDGRSQTKRRVQHAPTG